MNYRLLGGDCLETLAEILQRAGLAEKAEKAQAEAGQTSLFGEAA